MRAFNSAPTVERDLQKGAVRAAVPYILLARKTTEVQLLRAHQMDPDQDIYCSKEPSVVHGSQLPATRGTGRPHSGPRALYWRNFLRCGHAGRSPAQPVIGNALNRPR